MFDKKQTQIIICMFLFVLFSGVFVYASPERIISLAPALTERIYLLGMGDKIVGNTTYCRRPVEAINKEKIGTVVEADIEKILSLKPDLVIAVSLTKPKLIKKMKRLGLRVEIFNQPSSFKELLSEFKRLGKILNKRAEASDIVDSVEKTINEIKEKAKDLSKPKVFVQIGSNPLFTATKESFVNDFIKYAGAFNIASDAKNGLYSREKVLERNPDIILVVTMGIVGKQEKEHWLKYSSLQAAKSSRIHILDSYKICSPSPVDLSESLKEVFNLFHSGDLLKDE